MSAALHTGYAGWQMADLQNKEEEKEGEEMGRQPRKIEQMTSQIKSLLWKICYLETQTDDSENVGFKWVDSGRDYDLAYSAYFEGIMKELREDFTPDERIIVLRMFDKN